MDLGLRGKVAFVAAGSKGLGRAVAEELAAEGVTLAINARGPAALESTCESIRNSSRTEVLALPGDVSSSEQIDSMMKTTIERFGQIDILITNAGGPPS